MCHFHGLPHEPAILQTRASNASFLYITISHCRSNIFYMLALTLLSFLTYCFSSNICILTRLFCWLNTLQSILSFCYYNVILNDIQISFVISWTPVWLFPLFLLMPSPIISDRVLLDILTFVISLGLWRVSWLSVLVNLWLTAGCSSLPEQMLGDFEP